jgi:hypothetical protein
VGIEEHGASKRRRKRGGGLFVYQNMQTVMRKVQVRVN